MKDTADDHIIHAVTSRQQRPIHAQAERVRLRGRAISLEVGAPQAKTLPVMDFHAIVGRGPPSVRFHDPAEEIDSTIGVSASRHLKQHAVAPIPFK